MPTPTRAARSSGSSSDTTAVRSSGRSWKASRSGSATRSTCSARSAPRRRAGRVSGGGARSRLWLRIVASALGIPLERTESEEGSAFGAALLGGVAGGVFGDVHEAVERCVRVTERIEPDPHWREAYAELHARHQSLYPALHPVRVAP